ncbi:N-acetylglucosamine/diacetylchitobiose ABC transporter substrate-binding protein [Kribbella sp. VKM Ac-2568]|uniref:N-acetylglucosamine/diacetylchitobiose ABC transporter substrate-binding protein n=1 Tax=Kribbella sp. VKM Ac-2568 TaxID=2512219 RepID=UPI00104D0A28|nr:N-acetylglucosamine/diacetylchitobiose ABC transporter substrate-binding protein [Kribbella sp. VKM Ac-2568]TCM46669.1 N-acetylglucosamine transport system substrate-binding protein [Kribbella sp. VKM Ac-2568]
MTTPNNLSRRLFLQRAAVGTLLATGGSTLLAACAGSGSDDSGNSGGGADKTAENPFGMADKSTVDAVIFNGGYGYDYVTFAANIVQQKHAGSTVKVAPSTQIAQQLQPRFVGGNPPDLIDNSGANSIGFNTILDQLATLDDVFEANNLEGTKIADTLYAGVKAPGTFGDKFVAINYVLTLYGLWYSDSLFKANGWTPPKTYDEALDLGAKAKAKGKYLFVWGKEAATYYQTLAVDSAIKEGGDEVRLSLENLEADCWSKPQIQGVFKAMETMVKNGYFVPGGAGTQFTAAQAKWSNDQQAVLYPSGSWIENEMKKATKTGFDMKGIPEPTLTAGSKLPYAALRSGAGEPFVVPSKAKNVAGGKEVLRAMLSKDAATNFAKTRLAPTIVKGLVPADGFGSSALVSQAQMLDAAGTDVFNYQFVDLYGMNTDQLVVWNSFLSGKIGAADLTKGLQQITDKVRNDSSVKKIPVTK